MDNTITVGIRVVIAKEDDYFVAYCPELNVSSYATTPEKAKQRFEEELNIFFEETSKKGSLEKLLLQLGWTLVQKPHRKYEFG
jgi:predicted RNase H-like HicB family nuclease